MFDLLIAKVTIVLLLRYLDSYVRQRLPLPMDPIQILMFGASVCYILYNMFGYLREGGWEFVLEVYCRVRLGK